MVKRKNVNRDRTGEEYGHFIVKSAGPYDDTWLIQCICGTKQLCTTDNLRRKRSCGCKNKARNKKKSIGLSEFEEYLYSSKRKSLQAGRYSIDYPGCKHPVIGTLINQYTNSATFYVQECHPDDEAFIKRLNNRVNIGKSLVKFLD